MSAPRASVARSRRLGTSSVVWPRPLVTSSMAWAGEAGSSFKQALEVARHQSARSLELRAAISLANLWQTQQRREEARDLIEPVYRWFAEGAETADVRLAGEALEALH